MRSWTWHRWTTAVVVTMVAGLVIGIPTGVIESRYYSRMTPVLWWNYPVWGLSAVLAGLVVATYVRSRSPGSGTGRVTAGGLLSAFAVGCPICNKIVVALVGLSGALNLWAPIQPVLGVASLGLLGVALRTRLRGERACTLPDRSSYGVRA